MEYRLPSCGRGFESQGSIALYEVSVLQTIYAFYGQIFYHICRCIEKRTKINNQRGLVWPILNETVRDKTTST